MRQTIAPVLDLGSPRYFDDFLKGLKSVLADQLTDAEIRYAANTFANRMKKTELFGNCIAGSAVSLGGYPSYEWPFGEYWDEVKLHSGKTVYLTVIYE